MSSLRSLSTKSHKSTYLTWLTDKKKKIDKLFVPFAIHHDLEKIVNVSNHREEQMVSPPEVQSGIQLLDRVTAAVKKSSSIKFIAPKYISRSRDFTEKSFQKHTCI